MNEYSTALVEKAREELTRRIDEVSVLYSLVQLEKAAQDSGQSKNCPTLNLYRCWIVHTNLDRNKSLVEFFAEWDQIIDDIANQKGILHATYKSQEALKFAYLFAEMRSLNIHLDDKQRYAFVNALVQSLFDAPLRWDAGKNVKEFRFTFDQTRKFEDQTYLGHMQIRMTQGLWINGPELLY